MDDIRYNLIGKKYGIGDHMPADKVTDIIFPNVVKYEDIIKRGDDVTGEPEKYGSCIKNQYASINWIKTLIGNEHWKGVGKEKALYEYFVNDSSLMKPNLENDLDEDYMYTRASGDMQYDFDDLEDYIIEDIKRAFLEVSKKNPSYNWFEYSWSHSNPEHELSGCHVRIYVKLNLKTKVEWGFYYIHFLNGLLKYVNEEYRNTVIEHIDWSCCSVTRGFAIPYNEGGVYMGYSFDENKVKGVKSEDDLDKLFKHVNCSWYDEMFYYYTNKIIRPNKRKELEKMGFLRTDDEWSNIYSMEDDWEFDENHPTVSGEIYNYNWRLSLVTTLMGVFNKDKDIVRNIVSVIYKYIRPYKQHTYEEMIGNELEKKIFKRGNFDLEPSHEMIKELSENWGLKIKISKNIK